MKKEILVSVLIVLLSLPLGGCWGKREVEQLGFVFAIGVDLGAKPGTYKVTVQMGVPQKGGEGGGGKVEAVTYTVESLGMRESAEKLFTVSSRRPFVGTTKVIVLGQDVAKDGINNVLDFFQRYYELRRTVYLVLAKGTAQELLNVKTRQGELPALSIETFMNEAKESSAYPVVRLGHYLTLMESGSTAPVIPQVYPIKPGEEGIEYKPKDEEKGTPEELHMGGAGVFRGDRLETILNEQETKGYVWLRNEANTRFLRAKLGGEESKYYAGGRITRTDTKWKLEKTDGGYGIHYTIKADLDIDEFSGPQKERDPQQWFADAKTTLPVFTDIIKKECEAAVQKSRELRLDFLGIGRHIEAKNPRYWEQIKDKWEDTLPEFPVTVDVEITPENAGASFNSPVNPPGKGQE